MLENNDCYHILHFDSGFIRLPAAQLKSRAKESKLLNGPLTLNLGTDVRSLFVNFFSECMLYLAQWRMADAIQNSWLGV